MALPELKTVPSPSYRPHAHAQSDSEMSMQTRIHVNQHQIARNRKTGETEPVLTVKTYKTNDYASTVEVLDKDGQVAGRFVYSPDKPLSCGARVWFETNNAVMVVE